MLDAAIQREERQHRFQGAMVANLMNATGRYRRPVTVELLLGTKKPGRSFAAMSEQERKQAIERAVDKAKRVQEKMRGKQKKAAKKSV
ncbi:MAG: hypothetical protein JWO13_2285 [Acidobacteriales bacterium]|nr:hypothetical protein [Terriglobales bacterium]